MFNIATSELDMEPVNTAEMIKFADDSYTIIPVYGSQDDSRNAMQHIKQWCSDNDFLVNDKKSKVMTIHSSPSQCSLPVLSNVEDVEEMKILGVTFDYKLTFKPHINNLCKKLSSSCYLLSRLKSFGMKLSELEHIYEYLIESQITYALPVWACANITTLKSIDRVQEKAIKLGIIRKFNPIDSLIERMDASLLQQAVKNNFHILHHLVPQREDYSTSRLRNRTAHAQYQKLEKHMKLFPQRATRCNL